MPHRRPACLLRQGGAVTRWRKAAPSTPAPYRKSPRTAEQDSNRRYLSRRSRPLWKGQLGNSRTVERGQSQKSVVPLGGTEGSKPAPSSSESTANPTSSGADDPDCFALQDHGAARPPASAISDAGDPLGAETGGDVTPSNPSPSRGESCANLHAGGAGPDGESQISLTDPTAERWRRIHMLR